jgi:N-carbamoylputrescine amidase
MTRVTLAAIQMACGSDRQDNIERAEALIRRAAKAGGQIILLPELFEGPYFPQDRDMANLSRARPADDNDMLVRMGALARELGVVLPISFFERTPVCCFNSVMVFDADGTRLGVYRKSHVPDDDAYYEKYYFTPGDTGFRVWRTQFGAIGVGICWDQWFPEAARIMTLQGADFLLYPTAIGSDPVYPGGDPKDQWETCIRGHSAANWMPIVIANRIGLEAGLKGTSINFFGSSLITGPHGDIRRQSPRGTEDMLLEGFDLEELRKTKFTWGMMRDRRPELYSPITGYGTVQPS